MTAEERPGPIGRVVGWLDSRTGVAQVIRHGLRKVFPDHWSFLLGEVALFCFIILLATGTFLTFFYVPSSAPVVYQGTYGPLQGQPVSAAYDSVLNLSFEVRAGLLMRQIHHWTALVFVGVIVLHLCRIFFTGAFRRPRELNWIIGFTLLVLAIGAGFTGYSLPDDLLSGTGARIAYSALLSDPVHRSVGGLAGVRWRVPDDRADQPLLRRPHPVVAGRDRGPADGAPRHPRHPEAHAVPRRRGARGQRRGSISVADPGLPLDRPVLHHRGDPGLSGRTLPGQPHLAVRAVRRGGRELARPAGLVRRLARRGPAHLPAVRAADPRHRPAVGVHSRRRAAGRPVHDRRAVAVHRGADHRRPGGASPARPGDRPADPAGQRSRDPRHLRRPDPRRGERRDRVLPRYGRRDAHLAAARAAGRPAHPCLDRRLPGGRRRTPAPRLRRHRGPPAPARRHRAAPDRGRGLREADP